MPRIPISRIRFRWKTEPWKELDNIQSIWIYCQKGILSFELELNPSIQLPTNKTPLIAASIHKQSNNYIRVRDPHIISQIGSKVKNLTVKGAIGRGVWLGEVDLSMLDNQKSIPIYSTLHDWQEWKNFINSGVPNL